MDEFGDPVSKQRYIYGEAFAIYGLSEYARAMGCNEALEYARKLVASLEKHVYDPVLQRDISSPASRTGRTIPGRAASTACPRTKRP